MTALPLHDFTDAERAKLEAIEAAPAAEESVRERLMDALAVELESLGIDGQMSAHACEYLADAALAVLSGPSSDAERAVERVLDFAAAYERGDIGDPGRRVVAWMIRVAVTDSVSGTPTDAVAGD